MSTVSDINQSAVCHPASFVKECETAFLEKMKTIVKSIDSDFAADILLLAGPSCAGKTTGSAIISKELEKTGRQVYTISLDDYYKNTDEAYVNDEGKIDYEAVDALDLVLLTEHLQKLAKGEAIYAPVFDFSLGRRTNQTREIHPREKDCVIVEGLHALNPVITENIPKSSAVKVYISIFSKLKNNDGNTILSSRELRFIRRVVRDYYYRASSVTYTYNLWENVIAGEEKYLFPYEDEADFKIDSFHPSEACILKNDACILLKSVDDSSPYRGNADALLSALNRVHAIDINLVSADSLLKEFINK